MNHRLEYDNLLEMLSEFFIFEHQDFFQEDKTYNSYSNMDKPNTPNLKYSKKFKF